MMNYNVEEMFKNIAQKVFQNKKLWMDVDSDVDQTKSKDMKTKEEYFAPSHVFNVIKEAFSKNNSENTEKKDEEKKLVLNDEYNYNDEEDDLVVDEEEDDEDEDEDDK